jgi:hypothetical protein
MINLLCGEGLEEGDRRSNHFLGSPAILGSFVASQ